MRSNGQKARKSKALRQNKVRAKALKKNKMRAKAVKQNKMAKQESPKVFDDIKATEDIEKGICPECGGKLKFAGVVRREDLAIKKDYGGGYYELEDLHSHYCKARPQGQR